MTLLTSFVNNEQGASAIEYGLIGALISIAAIVGMTNLGTKLNTQFNNISTKLS